MSKNTISFLNEIKNFTEVELNAKIEELKTKLHKFKMSNALTPIENPSQLKSIRRDIARLYTELTKRVKSPVVKKTEVTDQKEISSGDQVKADKKAELPKEIDESNK